MKGFLLSLVVCSSYAGFSQATLRTDRTEIRIGDQVRVTITTDLREGKEWTNTATVWPDSMQGIEVVSGPEWNRKNESATQATWKIAFFDTGWVRIPSLPVVILHQGRRDTFFTKDIPVRVLTVEPDSAGLEPLKDIYKQPFSLGYYKRYLPHLGVFLLVLAGIYYWLRQRRGEKVVLPESPPIPLPHQWAYAALQELAEKKLWQQGEVKEHYSLLTSILRSYLERRFGIHALEQTSEEILDQLRQHPLSTSLLMDTERLLSVSDLIKFAKADPGMDIHAATIERVRSFVLETTPVFRQGEAAESKADADEVVE